jgi:outer membrane protein OmpA-like peptidoglycan-associated protein
VEDKIGDILSYNEAQERVLVGKTKDSSPTYYYVFVTSYRDGNMPDRLRSSVTKDSALAELVVVTPQQMEKKMTFVNAGEMSRSLADSGKIALYRVYFDTDKDSMRPDSQVTLQEIAKLLAADRSLKVSVVGHTDNQGRPDYNLDLSRRRAAAVVQELTSKYGIAADRLSSFGCGFYAPVASNDTEDGKVVFRSQGPPDSAGFRFSPDGKLIAFVIEEAGVDNICLQPPVDGSKGRKLTNFNDSERIQDFRWSPDGKSLAILRFSSVSDVILLHDTGNTSRVAP